MQLEQVAELTGRRYLDGYTSDDAQYAALMTAGATFAQQYGLRPGIAVTPAQMAARITGDDIRIEPGNVVNRGSVVRADALGRDRVIRLKNLNNTKGSIDVNFKSKVSRSA